MSSGKIFSFTDLACWKSCRKVRNRFTEIIKKLPGYEKYALADGMRRVSRSITQNIAEGFGRFHYQENMQFCRHSRGSLFELKDQLITAFDEKYIEKGELVEVNEMIDKSILILNGYIKYLAKAKEKNINSGKSVHETQAPYLTKDELNDINNSSQE